MTGRAHSCSVGTRLRHRLHGAQPLHCGLLGTEPVTGGAVAFGHFQQHRLLELLYCGAGDRVRPHQRQPAPGCGSVRTENFTAL